MRHAPLPLSRDLVLIGGGHAHALLLRRWAMDPLPGARLTLIDPGPTTAYSGMLPGFVAGHYDRDALDIDLVRLARAAGARLILDAATGIDLKAREIRLAGRRPVGFDVAALDVGVTSSMPDLPGFAEHAVPAKPLGPFARRWAAFVARGRGDAAVIGAGVAGAELAMAMAHRLGETDARVHLLDTGPVLSEVSPGAERRLRAALERLGVVVHEGVEIAEVTPRGLRLADGATLAAGFVAGAAGARPHGWLAETGLDLHAGFVAVDGHLASSDPAIFASGDCAHLSHAPRPKAGVFAVRAAPVLYDNLRAALSGGARRRFKPQRDYLKLVSLGAKRALADRSGLAVSGALMWRWKDRIDRRFMDRLGDLPQMAAPALPEPHALGLAEALGPKPLCGGCGAKVGAGTLEAALARRAPPARPDVTPLPGDDAALLATGGARQVLTTDHLRALWADPEMMTRIAVTHALGDIWAMGAAPQAAVLTVILPRLSERLAARSLDEILAAAEDVLRAAGADLVGGHTTLGDELSIGLSATGLCAAEPIGLAGGRPGDLLVLTKPLGSGTVMAAEMAGAARGAEVAAALAAMQQPQGAAAALLGAARAMTDVTGFGLMGHAANIARASGTGVEVRAAAVPLLEGTARLARAGIRSSIYGQNLGRLPGWPDLPETAPLFDPQTAGGLLAALPEDRAAERVAALRAAGFDAAMVGRLTELPGQVAIV
ncbi:selenide, water dikinase SelD [Roseivivax sp. CAU 1761]